MKQIFLLCLAVIAIALPLVAGNSEMFDKVDVDKILADDALLNEYINCFLDKGPCSAGLLTEFKKILPEVIATGCEKCTNAQKGKMRKLIKTIYERKPNTVPEFHKKYDPTGEYEPKLRSFLSA